LTYHFPAFAAETRNTNHIRKQADKLKKICILLKWNKKITVWKN